MAMGRGKGPTGRTAKFERRPRATLRMGEPKVDASSSDGSHASDTADRGTEQLGVIFSKASEPARGRSKRETASATVPAGLRKGEVVLALPVTNVRARHAQHTGLGYVHADGGRSSQHVVTGRWAISFVGRSCGVSASRPPPPADVGRASRHGDGRPPGVLGASASQHGRPNLSRRGTKVCIALFGFAPFLGTRVWAAAGRTGQGLAAAADAADHSRKAPTSPRHDDARRGLAGYDHDTSGRRHAAAMCTQMSGCSAAVASVVASMASSVSLLAAMITEEAAAASLARRKRSHVPPRRGKERPLSVCLATTASATPEFAAPCFFV